MSDTPRTDARLGYENEHHGANMLCRELERELTQVKKTQTWRQPDSAPLDGTMILGDFGWSFAIPAVWDPYGEQWVVVTVQGSPMKNGPDNYWLETDTEKQVDLKRWLPIPKLPKAGNQ